MDSLTHGLLGLTAGALRKPDAAPGEPLSATDRATLFACVLAAELPDLDYLWPAENSVLQTLQAHRGPSHSLLAAPLVALIAVLCAKLVFRRSRALRAYPFALLSVLFGHLLADAWTGWGTRLFLPFSKERVTLDWMMVLDPLFTLPLLAGAIWGLRRMSRFRTGLLVAAGLSLAYLSLRIGVQQGLSSRVRAIYPQAQSVHVFPTLLGVTTFRYLAVFRDRYVSGEISAFAPYREFSRHPKPDLEQLPRAKELAARLPTLREALAWARFPLIAERARERGGVRIEVADLRYHLHGKPTLALVLDVNAEGRLEQATLERGGSFRSLFERWRRN